MKELPYFRFYTGEWIQGNISAEDLDLQGLFINVCCYYWNQDCSLTKATLEKRFKNDIELLNLVYKLKYVKITRNGRIMINFLDKQYKELLTKHEKSVYSGRKGGLSKAKAELKQSLKLRSSYKDKDKDKIRDKNKEFIPPLLLDFIQYFKENGFPENLARKVFIGYEVAQWHDSSGKKIKNWKQKCQHVWFTDDNKQKYNQQSEDNKVYPGVFKKRKIEDAKSIKEIINNKINKS